MLPLSGFLIRLLEQRCLGVFPPQHPSSIPSLPLTFSPLHTNQSTAPPFRDPPPTPPTTMLRRTAILGPRIVIDKNMGPHGEKPVLKNMGTDLDNWLFSVPELQPQAPPELGFKRTRPLPPPIITDRMTLRVTKELHLRYCPFLVGGDEAVNGNVERIIKYLNTEELRRSNNKTLITIETVQAYQPPEYIVHYNSGKTYRLEEWSGAKWQEIIQALQRAEYQEVADCLARDEEVDTFHWHSSVDQVCLLSVVYSKKKVNIAQPATQPRELHYYNLSIKRCSLNFESI